jgi:2-oxo-4-hydroxy-4-carboxy--5-ureidoimidazoline (OHCU) decarboxylase
LCGKTFPGETQHTGLLTAAWESDTTKELGKLMAFIGAVYRSADEEQRLLNDRCITKAHPSMGERAHKSWEPGAPCTAYGKLNGLENIISSDSDSSS